MARIRKKAFVWKRRKQLTAYTLKIDSVDYTTEALGSGETIEFIRTINPNIGGFKFSLENTTAEFSDKFSGGETVQIYLDFADGDTKRFEGVLEKVENVLTDSGYTLRCEGSHLTGELLDITVTQSYTGNTTITNILKGLIDDYLTGFTYSNIGTFSETPTINWQNKPFWDCVSDLCDLATADCYFDESKDCHFFTQGSVTNYKEAAVWNDTLINIEGLGTDTIDVRNKVIVYGKDDEGFPIIHTAPDSGSQTSYGTKEKIIRDEDIKTEEQAKERADAELAILKDTKNNGKVTSWILPTLTPGDMFYVISPLQKIHSTFRAVEITHKLPSEQTVVKIERVQSIPTLFKDRFKKELALESVDNINKMEYSYNFTFDTTKNIDTVSSDTNIAVVDGRLYLSSGIDGTMISNTKVADSDITAVEIRIKGETYSSAKYYISVAEIESWEEITNLNELVYLSTTGKYLKLKIILNSASTRIDSAVVLFK